MILRRGKSIELWWNLAGGVCLAAAMLFALLGLGVPALALLMTATALLLRGQEVRNEPTSQGRKSPPQQRKKRNP